MMEQASLDPKTVFPQSHPLDVDVDVDNQYIAISA
jgi:hypothetical protein